VGRPLLALVAIVKDEAKNILATLLSTKGARDLVLIHDTGSTDGTQEIIRSQISEGTSDAVEDVPFVAFEPLLPFRLVIDYAATRNKVLDAHAALDWRADFTLMLSGDETLVEERPGMLREFLEKRRGSADGAYMVTVAVGPRSHAFPRVLRTSAGWRYEGAVHEVPRGPNGETDGPFIPGVRIVYRPSDPERHAERLRKVDLPILEHLSSDERKPVEERAQAIWFLGQTHELLGEGAPRTAGGPYLSHMMAAMALYWRRFEIAGDRDKQNYALVRYFAVAEKIGFFNPTEMRIRLEQVVSSPGFHVPEVRLMLAGAAAREDARRGLLLATAAAKYAHEQRGAVSHIPTDDRVEWMALRLAAECAREMKNPDRARSLAIAALDAGATHKDVAEYLTEGPEASP
jgi:hypothetical protein